LLVDRADGLNPKLMKGWLNLALAQYGDGNCESSTDNCNMNGTLDAWHTYGIPSLYGDLPIQWCAALQPADLYTSFVHLRASMTLFIHMACCMLLRDTSPSAPRVPGAIFLRPLPGLAPGWEASLEALVASDIKPHFGPAKALRGVFLGRSLSLSLSLSLSPSLSLSLPLIHCRQATRSAA
jgi:hypothetical protein